MAKMNATKHRRLPIIFLLPSLAGFLMLYIIPFAMSFYYTLIDGVMAKNFVGLQNYISMLTNPSYQMAFKNSALFLLLCVPTNMLLAFVAASLLKSAKKYRLFYSVAFMIPLVLPTASVVFFWRILFNPEGLLNKFLLLFGHVPVSWLDTNATLGIICLAFLWKNLGFNIVLFQAGLDGIPSEYYEFSRLEGAGLFANFWHITRVYISPTTFLVLLMSIVHTFKSFKEVFALVGAFPHGSSYMLQQYMNNQFFNMDLPKMSTSAYILAILVSLLVAVLFRVQARVARSYS